MKIVENKIPFSQSFYSIWGEEQFTPKQRVHVNLLDKVWQYLIWK